MIHKGKRDKSLFISIKFLVVWSEMTLVKVNRAISYLIMHVNTTGCRLPKLKQFMTVLQKGYKQSIMSFSSWSEYISEIFWEANLLLLCPVFTGETQFPQWLAKFITSLVLIKLLLNSRPQLAWSIWLLLSWNAWERFPDHVGTK